MKTNALIGIAVVCLTCVEPGGAATQNADKKEDLRLEAPTGWNGERIALPPSFAPDMKLKGVEEVRFAPGMFDAKAGTFFSYVLVFRVESEPALTEEVVHREMLAYYRGLSVTVLKGRNIDVDPKDFTLKLTASKPAKDAKRPQGLTSFKGELSWVEPFVTRKRQALHFELEAWQDVAAKHGYLFVIASPKSSTEPVWATMKKIRASFHNANK